MRGGDSVTVRLNRVFETVCDADGKLFTNTEEIVTRMTADGYRVTPGYISQLRSGSRTKPSPTYIEGLARAFGVSVSYIFDETREQGSADGANATVDADVRLVALRTAELSEEGRQKALLIVDQIRRCESERRKRA